MRYLVMFTLMAALAGACLAPVAAAQTRPALEQARRHAATHARCLGRHLPARLQETDSVTALRRYIRATWREMRWPCWRGRGAAAWMPLARHAGWPEPTMPMLERVIRRESGGDPGCVTGCYVGLLQIGRYHTSCDLTNPYTNLRYGLAMWRRLGWRPWAATAW